VGSLSSEKGLPILRLFAVAARTGGENRIRHFGCRLNGDKDNKFIIATGRIVNVITNSGTDDFHGNVEVLTDNVLKENL